MLYPNIKLVNKYK